jgi:uncharacterized small protein (DUF1192 family)
MMTGKLNWDRIVDLKAENERLRADLEITNNDRAAMLESLNVLHARITDLRDDLERAKRERDEERSLLVFLASAYVAARKRFGEPGTETWWQFPLIQGSGMVHAVERLAAIWPLVGGVVDPRALADRICGAVEGDAHDF